MKLLVFAHVPPPHHGQSRMVKLLVERFGGNRRQASEPLSASAAAFGVECYHVNAQLSEDLEDIGRMRWRKVFLLLSYCAQAIWLRFRHRIRTFYYVPAAPRRSAVLRDWAVMLLCRPLFRHLIFHWHAVGLGEWLQKEAHPWVRRITLWLMGRHAMSIVLSRFNEADAAVFRPRRVAVVINGIADPCPGFEKELLPKRQARAKFRGKHLAGQAEAITAEERTEAGPDPECVRVLYLAHCTRDKGMFDCIEGVRLANEQLRARGCPLRMKLTLGGAFLHAEERAEFDRLLAQPGAAEWIHYAGFIPEAQKWLAIRDSDLFCFPTFFAYEGQPVNIIEAMALGLPIVTTRWRAIPEFIPPGYAGLIEPRDPRFVASALIAVMTNPGQELREVFLRHFSVERHLQDLAKAIQEVEGEERRPGGKP